MAALSSLLSVLRAPGSIARELAKGSASGLVLSVSNRVVTLGSGVLLARALGIDQFGVYSLAIAFAMVVGVFVEMGLPTLLVREVARADRDGGTADHHHILRDAVVLTLASSLVAATVIVVGMNFPALTGKTAERAALITITALLPLSALTRVLAAALMGRRQILRSQFAEMIIAPAIVLVGAAVLYLRLVRPGAEAALFVQIGANAVGAICAWAWLRRALPGRTAVAGEARRSLLTLGRAGLPFLLANIALLLSSQVDTVVVGVIGHPRDVALYRVGAQGAVLCTFAMQVLQSVSSPFIARLQQDGATAAVRRLFRTVQAITFGFSLAMTIVFAVAGRELIGLLFGPSYISAQPILVIISAGYLVNAACGPIGMLLSMTGHERAMSRIVWATAIANLAAALVLGRLAGPTGVAVATALSVAGYHLLMRLYARRYFQL